MTTIVDYWLADLFGIETDELKQQRYEEAKPIEQCAEFDSITQDNFPIWDVLHVRIVPVGLPWYLDKWFYLRSYKQLQDFIQEAKEKKYRIVEVKWVEHHPDL